MSSKLCDSCQSATATLYCRPDSAFLCASCDSKVHAANKLASRHYRVTLCEVCEQAPAHVTCKADAAALCISCDRDIHSANPLAARHERLPITPLSESITSHSEKALHNNNNYDAVKDEAEAASWLLTDPKADLNSSPYIFSDSEAIPFMDLDYGVIEHKNVDGVVPDHGNFDLFAYAFKNNNVQSRTELETPTPSQSQISHSVVSSSMEVGVVPDGDAVSEVSNDGYGKVAVAADREAKVMRYREKRKNRRFAKTIRYASRKAYAETRPRIKGRFAKRTDAVDSLGGYGVVPTC
ncbi:unnamed protein product [Lathyrus sativus]|nr:unnamed protein product [Lathyrus sativus]